MLNTDFFFFFFSVAPCSIVVQSCLILCDPMDCTTPGSIWDLSFLTRDRTHAPCSESQSLNHWTAREVFRNSLNQRDKKNMPSGVPIILGKRKKRI